MRKYRVTIITGLTDVFITKASSPKEALSQVLCHIHPDARKVTMRAELAPMEVDLPVG